MEEVKQTRNPTLDVIRIFAFLCVVSAHFFLHGGYYSVYIVGGRLYLATLMRTFLIICVPLFLMLSGYLMRHKKPTKAYYKKLIRILREYVLASLFCMLCRAVEKGGTASDMMAYFFRQSLGILSYQTVEYGWYVEMYIGLFLLIPFLNVLYNGLQDKREKQKLIFTMMLLSGIPEVANSLQFTLPWTMIYNDPADFLTLLPNWWTMIYPVTYYFIGAYLSEYPLNLSRRKTAVLSLAVLLLAGTYSYWRNADKEFLYKLWQDHQSLFTIVQAVLVFHFFLQMDLRRIPSVGKKILAGLSELSFCAYLVSSVFDRYFYNLFMRDLGLLIHKPQYFFVLVPIVTVCSLACAFVLVGISRNIEKMMRKVASLPEF